MNASGDSVCFMEKAGRFRSFPLLLLVAVAGGCPQVVGQEDLPPGYPDEIVSVACSPSGALVATSRLGGDLQITDVASGKEVITFEKQPVGRLVFSRDGKFLATHNGSHVELWALSTREGQEVSKRALPIVWDNVSALGFSPDGNILAVGRLGVDHLTFKSYGEVTLWDVVSRKRISALNGKMDGVYSLAFSPDGKTLAVGTGQGSAHGSPHRLKGTVQLWDVNTGDLKTTLKPTHRVAWVEAVAFSPDGRTLATAATRIEGDLLHVGWQLACGAELWDVATGKERAFLKGHQDGVNYLVFSADGSKLATADHLEVKLWDTATGTQRASLKNILAPLTFSKDSKRLATLLPDGNVKWSDIEKLPNPMPQK